MTHTPRPCACGTLRGVHSPVGSGPRTCRPRTAPPSEAPSGSFSLSAERRGERDGAFGPEQRAVGVRASREPGHRPLRGNSVRHGPLCHRGGGPKGRCRRAPPGSVGSHCGGRSWPGGGVEPPDGACPLVGAVDRTPARGRTPAVRAHPAHTRRAPRCRKGGVRVGTCTLGTHETPRRVRKPHFRSIPDADGPLCSKAPSAGSHPRSESP